MLLQSEEFRPSIGETPTTGFSAPILWILLRLFAGSSHEVR